MLPTDPALHRLTDLQKSWIMAQALEDRKLEGKGHGQMRHGESSVRHEGGMKTTTYFENLNQGGLNDKEFEEFSAAERASGGKMGDEDFKRFQQAVDAARGHKAV